MVMRTAF